MGTLEASYLRMLGGVMPGGKMRSSVWEMRRDLRQRHFDLGVRLEIDADDRDAVVGLRFDVLDVVDGGGEGPLEDGDHALFHLLGRQALIAPDDADHRNVDVRKDIHRHGDDGRSAKNGDQHGHHYEGVRAPKGESDYPHAGLRVFRSIPKRQGCPLNDKRSVDFRMMLSGGPAVALLGHGEAADSDDGL